MPFTQRSWQDAANAAFSVADFQGKIWARHVPFSDLARAVVDAISSHHPRFIKEMLSGTLDNTAVPRLLCFCDAAYVVSSHAAAESFADKTSTPIVVLPEFDDKLNDAIWDIIEEQQDDKARFEWSAPRRAPRPNYNDHRHLPENIRQHLRNIAREANSELR